MITYSSPALSARERRKRAKMEAACQERVERSNEIARNALSGERAWRGEARSAKEDALYWQMEAARLRQELQADRIWWFQAIAKALCILGLLLLGFGILCMLTAGPNLTLQEVGYILFIISGLPMFAGLIVWDRANNFRKKGSGQSAN